jgi:hypothetical protein
LADLVDLVEALAVQVVAVAVSVALVEAALVAVEQAGTGRFWKINLTHPKKAKH